MPSLNERLSSVLPKDETFKVLHLQSFPRKAPNILKDNASKNTLTIKSLHWINLVQDNVMIFGMEVYVYIILNQANNFDNPQPITKLLYISKVDSTGLNTTKIKFTLVSQEVLRHLIGINVTHYTDHFLDPSLIDDSDPQPTVRKRLRDLAAHYDHHTKSYDLPEKDITVCSLASNTHLIGKPVVVEISLFTRAEKQYLFPYSYRNLNKHVLSDRDLLSWWLYLLNKLVVDNTVFSKLIHSTLTIPGEDKMAIDRFIHKYNTPGKKVWGLGGIYDDQGDKSQLAVFQIPLFPDDPKGRFLEHLVTENRIKKVSTGQFWSELAVRQEFRLSNIVGIIHIKGLSSGQETFQPRQNEYQDIANLNANDVFNDLGTVIVNGDHSTNKYPQKSTGVNEPPIDKDYQATLNNNKYPQGITVLKLKISEFATSGIKINNFTDDMIILTNKRLKYLKDLITSEEYDSSESARESFKNLDYLLAKSCRYQYAQNNKNLQKGFKKMCGKMEYSERVQSDKKSIEVSPVQQLSTMKKGKKRVILTSVQQ
ncbi:H3 histone acetyltransferase [Saccharomycopsis crataegensis]|uniref:histone acetyltransferase n=1 Tax=Saccharomycopsis crataegensis TaxID=43959 RepID=A0AAV5QQ04_9ASCO|nr:H3 histone acetyltransferase [Saccharomycopsis crataegensis]